jgi:mRNA-degrading endonuclease RelE of RelBE toxin-antitoxin system
MDAIKKALKKLTNKEKESVKDILSKLDTGNSQGLDIKKFKGREDVFRVKRGDLRIIYRKAGRDVFILFIGRRNEKTYRSA